jgi:hypothetical protein
VLFGEKFALARLHLLAHARHRGSIDAPKQRHRRRHARERRRLEPERRHARRRVGDGAGDGGDPRPAEGDRDCGVHPCLQRTSRGGLPRLARLMRRGF